MRRILLSALCLALTVGAASTPVLAQGRGGDGGGQPDEAAKKKKRDSEWNQPKAPLAALRNAGPCPFVKSLYDAARTIEFKDGRESPTAVAYSGEIEDISAGCAYRGDEPITMRIQVLFSLGRGPQAQGRSKTYRYWVAVTRRNESVLEKQYFDLPVTFPAGQDRVMVTDTLEGVTIPRADEKVSGGNFEVLVGFDIDEKMAAFNRDGKRFRVNAGQTAQAAAPAADKQ